MFDQVESAPAELKVVASQPDPVFDKVCQFLTPFNRHGIALRRETDIAGDMEVDSIAIFDVIMELEDSFDVTFPMEMVSEIKTIGELADTIKALKLS